MLKVLDELQKNYFVEIEDINVREHMYLAEKYDVKRTPFLVLFNDKREEIAFHSGIATFESILQVFKENENSLKEKFESTE